MNSGFIWQESFTFHIYVEIKSFAAYLTSRMSEAASVFHCFSVINVKIINQIDDRDLLFDFSIMI